MKGYKGYKNDLTCKDKQYAENTVFKEKEENIYKNGMHFCKNPFDVLDYYPLINSDGAENEFTDVKALEQCETKDKKIYCTTKLKVGHKLGITGFVKACVEYFKKEIKDNDSYNNVISDGRDSAQIASFCDYAQVVSSGYDAQIASSGESVKVASSGDRSKAASSGDYAQVSSSGDFAQISSYGDKSVIMCAGYDSTAKAKKGSWITLSEWHYDEDKRTYIPVCVKAELVDGNRIKEDTYYKLENGQFVETK